MDVCVVTFHNTAERIRPALRSDDKLWVRDNTQDNVGFARAANELARKGTDPVILFVNPDGDPLPGCFERLEEAVSAPRVVAAAPLLSREGAPPGRDGALSGACLAVRRDVFERVGGFDESFFMYGEDLDLSFRLSQHGRLEVCNDAVYAHDVGRRSWIAMFRSTRNALIARQRHKKELGLASMCRVALGNLLYRRWRVGSARLAAVTVFLAWDRLVMRLCAG